MFQSWTAILLQARKSNIDALLKKERINMIPLLLYVSDLW